MDIHRCRFIPYPSQAINALAFSKPAPSPSSPSTSSSNDTIQKRCPADLRLAIGRNNGDVEIWNPAGGAWVQETIFRGGKERSIEGLAWTQDLGDEEGEQEGKLERDGAGSSSRDAQTRGDLRLFSIGFSSSVTEWDLGRGIPSRHANGNFGTIWCLAAQPRWTPTSGSTGGSGSNRANQYLAAGCEDGTIILFSTDDGDLRYLRTIGKPSTKKPRVLSLTWKDRNTIVAGYSDSHIRVYDIHARGTVRNMTLGRSATGGNETLVWAVKCLPNGTIVSGDSSGDVKIWDAKYYSLVQSIHAHEADILDITTNTNGRMIVTCGADRRTTLYGQTPSGKGGKAGRWAQLVHRRYHECDVKALAAFESQELSIVVSGGLDTVPVVIPLRGWQKEYHRSLSHLPRCPPLSSAPDTRLLMSWWHDQVSIWQIRPQIQSTPAGEISVLPLEKYSLLTQMFMKDDENISAAQISRDGRYLAVATVSSVKVFQLRLRHASNGRPIMRAKKVDSPPSLGRFGARHVAFSPDGRWLCSVHLDNELLLLRVDEKASQSSATLFHKQAVRLSRTITSAVEGHDTGLGKYLDAINNIAFSADSRILAAGDLCGRISIWHLQDLESQSDQFANGVAKQKISRSSASSSSSSTSEDSSDDEDDDDVPWIHGQRWRKNLASPNLPRLDMPLLVMSFRNVFYESRQEVQGSDYEHAWPTADDRLVAVTTEHRIVELHALSGRLSDWSRRNPVSYLPQRFRKIRERAMGYFWDVSKTHDRLWLYGSTWMFMIDLAQDLPLPGLTEASKTIDPHPPRQNRTENKKRKREEAEANRLRNLEGGAGGALPLAESYIGVDSHLRRFTDPYQEDTQTVQIEGILRPDREGGAILEHPETMLTQIRREDVNGRGQQPPGNRPVNVSSNGNSTQSYGAGRPPSPTTRKGEKPGSYLSLSHRSILGIVPIAGVIDNDSTTDRVPEVAITERPLHEMDLPPRFDGGQDWET